MVGTSRDGEILLPGGGKLEDAAAAGELARKKVRGRWLYFEPDFSFGDILAEADRSVHEYLSEWLLGAAPFFHGGAARLSTEPDITSRAMALLIHQLCVNGHLGRLGLLNQSYQPYLANFALDDQEEIELQVAALRELLRKRGRVDWRQLPKPRRNLNRKAWKRLVLAHGEFLGLGYLSADRQGLIAW